MTNIFRQVALASVILVIVFASTSSVAVDKSVLVNEIYQQSGLNRQLDWMQSNFADARVLFGEEAQKGNEATRNMMAQLDRKLKQKFSDTKIRKTVLDQLNNDLSVDEMEQILQAMKDPVWLRARELESLAYQSGGIEKMQRYIGQHLERSKPRNARVDLINELINVTDATDLTLEMAIQGALMASRLMMKNMGKSDITEKHMENAARRQMESYRDQYRGMLVSQVLYVYRHMSDSQLDAYIYLCSSAVIRKLNRSMTNALLAVMQ
ncbi:MAG: hypothetical protein KAG53_09080 [Endozoicomonadaceae bacterium]|nr:hypothetical protein [Endozoicomonadaceae bacterium]